MSRILAIAVMALGTSWVQADQDLCIIITGLGGMPEYQENFKDWADKTASLFDDGAGARVHQIDGSEQRRETILEVFQNSVAGLGPESQVWLFLIGHANHNGKDFKFNIKGPDLTGSDMKLFLESVAPRKTYLVAATSASGALLPELAAEGRVVVTATRNKFERQPPLFLSFLLEAANSPEADSNKDGRVSLLEAYLFSRHQVATWFEERGRLQTEHAVLDDHSAVRLESGKEEEEGDISSGTGMLASAAYLSRPPEKAYRSLEVQQLVTERTAIEREIEDLKFRKAELDTAAYFDQLEKLLVKLATINEKIEELEATQ